MKTGDISFLNQLVSTLEKFSVKIEEDYSKRDSDSFNKSKKLILEITNKISKIIK